MGRAALTGCARGTDRKNAPGAALSSERKAPPQAAGLSWFAHHGLQVRSSKPTTQLENEPLVAVSEVRRTARGSLRSGGGGLVAVPQPARDDLIIRESRTSPSFAGAQSESFPYVPSP
jgi:hypothetical protein